MVWLVTNPLVIAAYVRLMLRSPKTRSILPSFRPELRRRIALPRRCSPDSPVDLPGLLLCSFLLTGSMKGSPPILKWDRRQQRCQVFRPPHHRGSLKRSCRRQWYRNIKTPPPPVCPEPHASTLGSPRHECHSGLVHAESFQSYVTAFTTPPVTAHPLLHRSIE